MRGIEVSSATLVSIIVSSPLGGGYPQGGHFGEHDDNHLGATAIYTLPGTLPPRSDSGWVFRGLGVFFDSLLRR